MAQTTEALNADQLARCDFHVAHAVEHGHSCTEDWSIGGRIDGFWNWNGGLDAEKLILRICPWLEER